MRKIDKIVIHHSASPSHSTTIEKVRDWHVNGNGWKDIAYHFCIDRRGIVHKGRKEKEIGAHTKGHNRHSLGICVFGNFEVEHITKPAYDSLVTMVRRLMETYSIPKEEVYYHGELKPTKCCGKNLIAMFPDLKKQL